MKTLELTNNYANKNPIPRLCGFTICAILSVVACFTTLNSGIPGANTIQITCVAIAATWGLLLLLSGGWKNYKTREILFAVIAFVLVAASMGIVWHFGYLTNTPLIGINAESEGIHRDTLYHVSIASGLRYYGYPSLLVNTGDFHNYHFGSHLILAIISKILDIHPYFTYCYIYPVLFLPLYASLILDVSKELRLYNNIATKITMADILLLMWFMTYYIFPQSWGYSVDNKISWIISESYCISLVLGLLFFKLLLLTVNNGLLKKYKFVVSFLYIIIIPAFIILITLSKVSVGLIFTCSIIYYLFRTKGLDIKYLLLEAFYVGIVLAIHFVPEQFYSPIISFSTAGVYSLQFMHFIRNYIGDHLLWGLYFFFTFLLSGVFIVYRTRSCTSVKDIVTCIKDKTHIVEETLLLICFFGALPGMIIAIGGGSAFYFSSVQQIIATVLLIGYGVINDIVSKIEKPASITGKAAVVLVIICLLCNPVISFRRNVRQLWKDCKSADEQLAESQKDGSYWKTIDSINRITENNKKDYYIYVSPSAKIWTRFANPDSAIFFYPAMTGVVCVGELYFKDGHLYTNGGKPKEDGYYYVPEEPAESLNEEEAYQKAIEDGKKALIVIDDNGMVVKETGKR